MFTANFISIRIPSGCTLGTVTSIGTTVEPLYNGHFGTSHFWVIFAAI